MNSENFVIKAVECLVTWGLPDELLGRVAVEQAMQSTGVTLDGFEWPYLD